jgi:hypothetical protein
MRYDVWSPLARRAFAAVVAVAVWGFAPSDGWLFAASAQAATVRIARDDKLQTIEGFGFFGARDVWWSPPADLVDPEWARLVIDDLGLSMWRNEYCPPADRNGMSDADWIKQRPVVLALRDRAQASGVPFKVLLNGVVAAGQHEVRL